MAYIKKLLTDNFLYYASYVIMDRAIPELDDGLKPVQRRILHSLFEMDDGKFHKVANVVGHCMKYHPHGDASIASALVVLANKGLFIDTQGNFGNPVTGDEASAPRYIECRCTPFAKEIFYRPKITTYIDSYDGRNKEPLVFPAKIPVILILGAEGIAVGMSTKILPHNPVEVLKAEVACLQGKSFSLLPDFPTGGIADCSDYADGTGRIRVRASLDTSDPKRIVIREVPYGSTTESLIASIEEATRAGHLKIASISDFTTDRVEIELKLARGVYSQEVVDALYAFTECEKSISCNCLVIKDEKPALMTVSEIVRYHAGKLLALLRQELEIERGELKDELFARTLERIFIEERIYKGIENKRTGEAVIKAVIDGFKPFRKELVREVTEADVEQLLKIPIRRISLYDINRAKEEMQRLEARLAEVERHLADLVGYAIEILKKYIGLLEKDWPRKTRLKAFEKVEAREVARRDIALRYDRESGYLGTEVSGEKVLEASMYDKVLVLRKNGIYTVIPMPDRFFAGQDILWVEVADKERLLAAPVTLVYTLQGHEGAFIKRTVIDAWLTGKDYSLVPEGAAVIGFSVRKDFAFTLQYAPKSRLKKTAESFRADRYPIRGRLAKGLRLTARAVVGCVGLEGAGPAEAAQEGPAAEEKVASEEAVSKEAASKETASLVKPAPRAEPEAKPEPKPAPKRRAKPAATAPAKPVPDAAPKPDSAKPDSAKPASEPETKPPSKGLLELARKKHKDS